MIPFNKPYSSGKELVYIKDVCESSHLSGNGIFTKKCQAYFEQKYCFKKCLLTTSGTDALEMCAMLCNLKPGDEVIIPSFTFVSTALAFLREGAKVVFADCGENLPNITLEAILPLVTAKTKVIVVVHYAGIACDMGPIMAYANAHGLIVVEDAAHAVDSFYYDRPLGSIGHLSAFSFHETKNISCGEGGMLAINDERFISRAEIIWEKGTNRAAFFRGMVNKYGWCDMGSSFLPSELNAAYLWAQLEHLDDIQHQRLHIWTRYDSIFRKSLDNGILLPNLPTYATNNAHMYFAVCPSLEFRTALIQFLKDNGVQATFHYLPLHSSPYYHSRHGDRELPNCDHFGDCLIRFPLFYELSDAEIDSISHLVISFRHNS